MGDYGPSPLTSRRRLPIEVSNDPEESPPPLTIALLHPELDADDVDPVAERGSIALARRLVVEATGSEPIVVGHSRSSRLASAMAGIGSSSGSSRLSRAGAGLPHPADLTAAFGIGGGYLRSTDAIAELDFRARHLPSLRLLAAMGTSGAYLPSSIGPFRRGLGRTVRRQLAAVGWVACRDDASARYIAGWANGRRLPDLAVCLLGLDRPAPERPAGPEVAPDVVAVALRSLRRSRLGFATIALLEERGFKVVLDVQEQTSDRGADRFGDLLRASPRPTVALAGGLDVALDAIAAGLPTLHLAEDRGSVGAFSDLGLGDFVVDAWTGEPSDVADRVAALACDPTPYWERIAERTPALEAAWDELVVAIQRVCEQPRRRRGWR